MGNPYRPPDADLSLPGQRARPSLGWRIYAVTIVGLVGIAFAGLFVEHGFDWMSPVDWFDSGVTTPAGLVGLVGYAFSKPIASQRFWRAWAPFQVIWDITFAFVFEPLGWSWQLPDDEPVSRVEFFTWSAIEFAVVAPLYVALFRYGRRAESAWESRAPSEITD